MKKYANILVTVYFLLLQVIIPLDVSAVEKQLFLLSGCPTPKSDAKFPSSLFKIDMSNNKLILVRDVIAADQGSEFVRPYYDERIIIIEGLVGTHSKGNRSSKFAFVDMNAPQIEKLFEISYPEAFMDIEEAHLLDIPSRGVYQSIYVVGEDVTKSFKLLGVNLSTMKQEELLLEFYKYAKISGIPGGATPGEVFVVNSRADGQIMIPTVKGKIESDWKLPTFIKVRENERIAVFVNNNDMLGLILSESRVKKKTGIGNTPFHVLDKKTNKWHSVELQGGKTGVRGFGPWFVGYVADEERTVDTDREVKRRKEDMTKTGTPSSWRFKDFKIYSPGILFIHNVQTNKKYMIETKQGDSEVLLVEDDTVYYRVNDEIYEAKISKNIIEAGTLLAKGEIVSNIHWAFIGPK